MERVEWSAISHKRRSGTGHAETIGAHLRCGAGDGTLVMPQDLNASHRTNRLLAALEPEDFTVLEPHLELIELTRGQVLYDTGEIISHAYFLHDAIISLVNVMEDGATNEVAVFGREGVAGLLSALVTREAFGRYVVQMSGTASRIAFERLNEVRNTCAGLRQLIMCYGEA